MSEQTVKVGGVDIPLGVYQKMLDNGLHVQKHDVVGTSPSIQVPHGLFQDQNVGGLFTRPGAEFGAWHTIVQPNILAMSRLFAGTTNIWSPEYDVISGINAINGSPADDSCSPGPKAGTAKLCTLRAQFGLLKIETDQADLMSTGGRINRADTDQRVINTLGQFPLTPDVMRQAQDWNTTLGLAWIRVMTTIVREMARVFYTGTQGASQGIFTDEFAGLDNLIIENPVDVLGNTCTAASSVVVDWNNADISGTVNGADIVDTISGMLHIFMDLAMDTSIDMASWEIHMDNDLFWNLTRIWPCSYLTNGCAVTLADGQSLNVDSAQQVQMRDQMRTGQFLWINGIQVPVVTTKAIARTEVGPGFSSDIYILNTAAMGTRTTYIEGFDTNNADIQQFVANGMVNWRTMNGGFYAETIRQTGACVEFEYMARPRLVVRTPWLSGRITNVNYVSPGMLYSRDAFTTGQYWKNGGRYYNTPPSYS